MILRYDPELKVLAQKLRKSMTPGEVALWHYLRGKQCHGVDFHRQKPIGSWIVDFYAPEVQLVIELDGRSHDFKIPQDRIRQAELEKLGLTVLRFTEKEVLSNTVGVVETIGKWIERKKNKVC